MSKVGSQLEFRHPITIDYQAKKADEELLKPGGLALFRRDESQINRQGTTSQENT
jgi:hypothetical protein